MISTGAKPRIFYGWVITGASFLFMAVLFGTRQSFGVFFKPLENEFDLTRAGTSAVFSIYMMLCSIFGIVGGRIFDRHGPRMLAFLMGSFTSISLLLTSQATSEWQLVFTYSLVLSVGTGAVYTVTTSLTSRWFARNRGFALGITTSGSGLGALMGPPFAAQLISTYNWRTAFVVMALIVWPVTALISLLLRKDPRDMGLLPDGLKKEEKEGIRKAGEGEPLRSGLSLREALGMSQFWFLAATWLSLSMSVHLIIVHVVPYALDLGVAPVDAALIVGLIGGAAIPGRILIGKFSDLTGRKALAVSCALIQAVSFLWLIGARELGALYAFAIAFGFSWGGLGTISAALPGDIFGIRSIGLIMGALSACWSTGAAAGPFMAGVVFDRQGNYVAAFMITSAIMLVTVILLMILGKDAREGKV